MCIVWNFLLCFESVPKFTLIKMLTYLALIGIILCVQFIGMILHTIFHIIKLIHWKKNRSKVYAIKVTKEP